MSRVEPSRESKSSSLPLFYERNSKLNGFGLVPRSPLTARRTVATLHKQKVELNDAKNTIIIVGLTAIKRSLRERGEEEKKEIRRKERRL